MQFSFCNADCEVLKEPDSCSAWCYSPAETVGPAAGSDPQTGTVSQNTDRTLMLVEFNILSSSFCADHPFLRMLL